jgi:hypothetical protein
MSAIRWMRQLQTAEAQEAYQSQRASDLERSLTGALEEVEAHHQAFIYIYTYIYI